MTTAPATPTEGPKSIAAPETPVVNMREKFKGFASKRFILTILFNVLSPWLLSHGVSADAIGWLLGIVNGTYVVGESAVATARAWTSKK